MSYTFADSVRETIGTVPPGTVLWISPVDFLPGDLIFMGGAYVVRLGALCGTETHRGHPAVKWPTFTLDGREQWHGALFATAGSPDHRAWLVLRPTDPREALFTSYVMGG